MLDKRLTKCGRILIAGGEIEITGFEGGSPAGDYRDCSCREIGILALLHALNVVEEELRHMIREPGGSGRVIVD